MNAEDIRFELEQQRDEIRAMIDNLRAAESSLDDAIQVLS